MKKKRIAQICIVTFLFSFILGTLGSTKAVAKLNLQANKTQIEKEEEVEVKVVFSDVSIASFTLELFFDNTKLEYKAGPENSNYVNNRILYTWVSKQGKAEENLVIGSFTFKALEEGITSIVATGEFYGENEEKVELENGSVEIQIGKNGQEEIQNLAEQNKNELGQEGKQEIINEAENQQGESSIQIQEMGKDNTNLKILRINKEGISPSFSKEIKQYYFVTQEDIESLEITAIPENKNATVTIRGNKNLKWGQNTIVLEVISEDKTKKSEYKIDVTKTKNIKLANTNLETLAINQGTLVPEFDNQITNYRVEVANDVEKLEMLAIPENINARTEIVGNEVLKIGDNTITITVTAEDKITKKNFEVIVHRRSEEEQIKAEEEQKVQIERVTAILEEQQQETKIQNRVNDDENLEKESKSKNWIGIVFVVILIITIGVISFMIVNKKKR